MNVLAAVTLRSTSQIAAAGSDRRIIEQWLTAPLGAGQVAHQVEEARILLDAEHPSSVVLPVVSP